jgi:sterol 14alpha-demethylase
MQSPGHTDSKPLPQLSGASPEGGHYSEFSTDPLGFLTRAHKECGEVGEFDLAGLKTVLLVGLEAQEAFFRAPETQLSAAAAYQMMVPVFGEGIQFGAPPEIERQQLRIQHQGVRHERMVHYAPIVAGEVETFIKNWGDEGELDIYEAFTELTLRTSTHSLLGRELRSRLTGEIAELYGDLERGIDASALRDPYQAKDAFRRRDRSREKLEAILSDAVRARREKGIREDDMLQIYMDASYEDGSCLTDHEITGMVIWFMFAGHHTSSNTATWSMIEFVRHPEYQAAVYEQVDNLWAKQSELSLAALRETPLLEGFIRESLRVHPPLNTLTRRVVEEFRFKDYVIPAGNNVMVSPYVSHKLPELFKNPERFDPYRQPHENPFATIAFGGGRHRCIGNAFAILQVRTIFCALLREYEFELAASGEAYSEVMPTLILRPQGPARIRYRRRKSRRMQ